VGKKGKTSHARTKGGEAKDLKPAPEHGLPCGGKEKWAKNKDEELPWMVQEDGYKSNWRRREEDQALVERHEQGGGSAFGSSAEGNKNGEGENWKQGKDGNRLNFGNCR